MNQEQQTSDAEEFDLPNKRLAIFNKSSGVIIGMVNSDCKDQINEKYFKCREIEIDDVKQKFIGDFDTGEVVDIDSAPVQINESELNGVCGVAIRNVMPAHKQLNAIAGVMRALINKYDLQSEEVDAFNEVFDFIDGRRKLNEKFKNAYKNGPDWNYTSVEEEMDLAGKQFEGGIHEELGPRSNYFMPCGLDGD